MRILVEKSETKVGTSKAGKPWKLYNVWGDGTNGLAKYSTFAWATAAPGVSWESIAPGVDLDIEFDTTTEGDFTNHTLKRVILVGVQTAPPAELTPEEPVDVAPVKLIPVQETPLDPVMESCLRQARSFVDRMVRGAPPVQQMYWVVSLACEMYRAAEPIKDAEPFNSMTSDSLQNPNAKSAW